MSKRQMADDIRTWSANKLMTWAEDCMMRYKLVGLSKKDAEVEIMHMLLVSTAGLLGTQTTATVQELVTKFAELVVSIRLQEKLDVNLTNEVDNNDN